MTWQETMHAVGGVAPDLGAEMNQVIRLIQDALAGELDPSLLRVVVSPARVDDASDRPPIITALEPLAKSAAKNVLAGDDDGAAIAGWTIDVDR